MPQLLIRRTWTFRASRWLRSRSPAWLTRSLSNVAALRRAPHRPGITGTTIARPRRAEANLRTLAQSPTVFASTWRMLRLSDYPVRCYRGHGQGGDLEPIDPKRVPWVGQLLRLLALPDPADWSPMAIAPARPGELLIAQLLLDLTQAGNAWCATTVDAEGVVNGLYRLHPQHTTLERDADGEEWWAHKVPGGQKKRYPRRTVFHIRLLSWEASGEGELGTGAAEPLTELLRAEAMALSKSADIIAQGGADIRVSGKTDRAKAFLQNPDSRAMVAEDITRLISGGDDGTARRVMVDGGEFEIADAGLKPADIQAPALLDASRKGTLIAQGVTPIAVGAADAGTYATSVQQYRVQADNDSALLLVLEACFLRPLARHFAWAAGGRWATKAGEVTAKVVLDRHPGRSYQRTDAITRMEKLVDMGWTPEQAAEYEGLDLPKPEGTPRTKKPGDDEPSAEPLSGPPRRPLGDTDGETQEPGDEQENDEGGRTISIREWLDQKRG